MKRKIDANWMKSGLNVGAVYWVKRSKVNKRLRVKINNHATWCGKRIFNSLSYLTYIDGEGNIKVKCGITGKETEMKTEVIK